jgi:hypothetical protein
MFHDLPQEDNIASEESLGAPFLGFVGISEVSDLWILEKKEMSLKLSDRDHFLEHYAFLKLPDEVSGIV